VLHRGGARTGKFAAVLAMVAVAIAASAGTALANVPAGDCGWPASLQPFAPWSDSSAYFLAPGGSFEGDLSGWTLGGDAAVVPGNESFFVNAPTDTYSLSLPAGSSATTQSVCVTVDSPAIRLFAMNGGSDKPLTISLNYTATDGKTHTAKVADIKQMAAWAATDQIQFLKPIKDLLKKDGQASVSFTFSVKDDKDHPSAWQIDDLYIDPLKSQDANGWGGGW